MNSPNTLGLPPLSTEEIDRIGARIDAGALVDDDVVRLFDSHIALTDRLAHANQEIAALQNTIEEAERLNVDQERRLDIARRALGRYALIELAGAATRALADMKEDTARLMAQEEA